MDFAEGIFPHPCEAGGCDVTVQYDDEPWCFEHSPDSGSYQAGYSAKAKSDAKLQIERDGFDEALEF